MSTSSAPDETRLAELVEQATYEPDADSRDRARRTRALAAMLPLLARRAKQAGLGAVTAGRWLSDELVELAPRIPVRDADALRRHHPGLADVEIAQLLVRNAKRTTAALGAAAGGVAAVEFAAPPTLLLVPVQLCAEILAVAAVELKLVAELHEILGSPAGGTRNERAAAYLMAWVRRRAVAPELKGAGLSILLGSAAKKELRSHVMRRMGRGTTKLAPFLAGAIAGAEVNRRATASLGEALTADLRGRKDTRWFRRVT